MNILELPNRIHVRSMCSEPDVIIYLKHYKILVMSMILIIFVIFVSDYKQVHPCCIYSDCPHLRVCACVCSERYSSVDPGFHTWCYLFNIYHLGESQTLVHLVVLRLI